MPKKMTHDEYVEKLKNQHPNLELLSEYKGSDGKIIVRCVKHNHTYETTPHRLNATGCQKCYDERRGDSSRKTTEQFIADAIKVHGNKYDYSKVEYKGNKIKVCIICPEHGEFWQTPNKHLLGRGCPRCADISNGLSKRLTTEQFINRSVKRHNNKYDYSKVEYKTYDDPVCIICPEHGEFWQIPDVHIHGHGCPRCSTSHLEVSVRNLLNSELYDEYYQFPELGKQNLDIYLSEYNVAIECQGGQHVMSINHFGGDKGFKITQERDIRKNKICKDNGIKLLYVFPQKHRNNLLKYNENNPNSIYTKENTFILEDIQSNKEEFIKLIKL